MPRLSVNLPVLITAVLMCLPAALAKPSADMQMPAVEPPELSIPSGLTYAHSQQYKKEFSQAIDSARKFCQQYKREHPAARNLAIVSDIDETIVDNREEFIAHPDKFIWSQFEDWIKQARAPVLKPTADFLKWARKEGFAIILVTGRPEVDRIYTIENLVRDGIAYDALYLRPENGEREPPQVYKSGVRKKLEDMGFTIVVNLGDQPSDLVGGHCLDCEKLPNQMYFLK
jgi:acid phosphatase